MNINKSKIIHNILSLVVNEIIYGAHITALLVLSLVFTILVFLDLNFDFAALIIPYLIAYIIYTYNYYNELEADNKTNSKKVEIC